MSPKLILTSQTLWLIQAVVKIMPVYKPPQDIRVENRHIVRPDGTKIRLRIYQPKTITKPVPVMLWLHGGGYLIGRPEMDDLPCIQFVQELGICVVSVDYRLAPKHPFPAGLDDSYAALQWVVSQAQQLGVDIERIAIGGESAGGGLAAALVQYTCDRQEIHPLFQLLVYPMLDDRTVLRPEIDDSNSPTWTQKNNRFGWESYLGQACGAEDVPAYAVPARRDNLTNLPPAWIGVGSEDIFHDEDVAYAQRLRNQGIACELVIVPGAFHAFDVYNAQIPLVQEFRKSQMAALRKYLFP